MVCSLSAEADMTANLHTITSLRPIECFASTGASDRETDTLTEFCVSNYVTV